MTNELKLDARELQLKTLFDEQEKRIEELEKRLTFARAEFQKQYKENAELKGIKDVATLIRANNDTVVTLMQLNNMLVSKNQQLTKAKDIIKKYMFYCKGELTHYKDIEEQAEQFLNGENIILEDAQAGNSPFDADEVFNKEMKAYPEGKVK